MTQAVPIDMIVFFVGAFLGAVVSGVSGFAFGLIASAIWLHVITPAQSAVAIAAFAMLIQGATLWKLRHAIQTSRLVPFVAGGAVGIPLGATALNWASSAQMRTCIGVALILFSIYSLLRPKLPAVRGGPVADGAIGIVSGIFGGSTGLAGIPVIVWSSLRRWSKDEQRALFQPVVAAVFAMSLLWFGLTGTISAGTLGLIGIGLPAVGIGTWLGIRLYGRLSEAMFRVVILVLLLISGLSLLPWPG
jgi:uncharacterized membrane protein YfcA